MLQFKLNNTEYCSQILALGLEGHCTSCFKRVMCISRRRHVEVHTGRGSASCGQGGQKPDFLVDVINR